MISFPNGTSLRLHRGVLAVFSPDGLYLAPARSLENGVRIAASYVLL